MGKGNLVFRGWRKVLIFNKISDLKENFKMICEMDMEFIFITMEITIKDNGKIIIKKAKE
jgi:hypothetical protein